MAKARIVLKAVPCPRCKGWFTEPIDRSKITYQCQKLDCRFCFELKKHHGLIFYSDGRVVRVGKPKE